MDAGQEIGWGGEAVKKFKFKARGVSGSRKTKFCAEGTVNCEGAMEAALLTEKLVKQSFEGAEITKIDVKEVKA